jgi:hypothetical protein
MCSAQSSSEPFCVEMAGAQEGVPYGDQLVAGEQRRQVEPGLWSARHGNACHQALVRLGEIADMDAKTTPAGTVDPWRDTELQRPRELDRGLQQRGSCSVRRHGVLGQGVECGAGRVRSRHGHCARHVDAARDADAILLPFCPGHLGHIGR